MAEPRSAVTDTHPLIFHAASGRRLGRRSSAIFKRCERRETVLYVPVSVIWECGLLARSGKIDLGRSLGAFFDDLFSNPAFQPFDLSPDQVFLADEMRFTTDPFDALIVAAARSLGLPLITRDTAIIESGEVRTVW